MLEIFTAAALRALDRAQARAGARGAAQVEPADLLAALADEEESRAAALLAEHGLAPGGLLHALGMVDLSEAMEAGERAGAPLPQSVSLRAVLGDASLQARAVGRGEAVGTEHLLKSLLRAPGPL